MMGMMCGVVFGGPRPFVLPGHPHPDPLPRSGRGENPLLPPTRGHSAGGVALVRPLTTDYATPDYDFKDVLLVDPRLPSPLVVVVCDLGWWLFGVSRFGGHPPLSLRSRAPFALRKGRTGHRPVPTISHPPLGSRFHGNYVPLKT